MCFHISYLWLFVLKRKKGLVHYELELTCIYVPTADTLPISGIHTWTHQYDLGHHNSFPLEVLMLLDFDALTLSLFLFFGVAPMTIEICQKLFAFSEDLIITSLIKVTIPFLWHELLSNLLLFIIGNQGISVLNSKFFLNFALILTKTKSYNFLELSIFFFFICTYIKDNHQKQNEDKCFWKKKYFISNLIVVPCQICSSSIHNPKN